ncbi:hypothetical protein JQ760_028055 (plasmid) [Klebsiella pneumoniae]|uniref:hypothetical protein n=1 Tax=Klebsiella pneumoniae TaxID=573 RepID=UPI001FAC7359|nr:hypothetical protein [Klebsiella pneumoniae]MCI8108486.1 hypothetical protein [Klebsiella pneumoniae]
MSKTVIRFFRDLIGMKKEKQTALRREHNDTLYFLRHGRAPVFTHPDDLTE